MLKLDDLEVLKFVLVKWYVELGVFFVSVIYILGFFFFLVFLYVCLNYFYLLM